MSFPENQRDPTLKNPTHKIPTQRGRYLIYYLLTCLTLEPEKNKNKKNVMNSFYSPLLSTRARVILYQCTPIVKFSVKTDL